MNKVQTENSNFEQKVLLRINNLPKNDPINVLDAFSANGRIWNKIARTTNRKIALTRIDADKHRKGIYLVGDNLRMMKSIDLSVFDVIDLDAYGIPYDQIKVVLHSKTKAAVFVTFIQSMAGRLPDTMLLDYGYTQAMIDKAPILFCRNGFDKLKYLLALNGVNKISYHNDKNKYYLYFKL